MASVRLFCGGINYQMNETQLQQWWEGEGYVVERVQVMRYRVTNQNRGFGFVTINTDESEKAVIERMNGKQAMGRAVTVNKADPKQPMSNGGGGREGRVEKREFQRR